MNQTLTDKKNNFRIQIRKKTVQDKISRLRANFQRQIDEHNQFQINQETIALTIQASIKSQQNLIQNIPRLKQLSFNINSLNVKYFIIIIDKIFYLIQKMDYFKETSKTEDTLSKTEGKLSKVEDKLSKTEEKNELYNNLLVILINISSEYNDWTHGDYLPIIRNLLIKQRQINTLWLLSNLLYKKASQNNIISKYLTRQLIKYNTIQYCVDRMNRKFQQQKHIQVFAFYLCSFITNSVYLTFNQHKIIVELIQKIINYNNELIDYFIIDSMIDYAPFIAQKNYYLLYSQIIKRFNQIYIKKKKTKMVLKYLQFIKTFVFSQIKSALDNQQGIQSSQIDSKLARGNYQRICITTIPYLTICLQNRSPQVKALLSQICCMVLVYYFPFINIENQQLFLSLIIDLKQSSVSILCKYSNKALYWQLKYACIFLQKIKQYKISKQIISEFISKNSILNAVAVLLKEKSSEIQIITQIIQLLVILFYEQHQINSSVDLIKNELQQISKMLQLILQNNIIKQERIFNKVQFILNICDKYK